MFRVVISGATRQKSVRHNDHTITDLDFVQFHLFAVFQKVSVRSSADIFISTRGYKKDFVRNEKNRFVPISLQTSRSFLCLSKQHKSRPHDHGGKQGPYKEPERRDALVAETGDQDRLPGRVRGVGDNR
jgi:hypothetical protein